MAAVQCPFDGITLRDDAKTAVEMDEELDAHLQSRHGMTLHEMRELEKTVPRSSPYFNH